MAVARLHCLNTGVLLLHQCLLVVQSDCPPGVMWAAAGTYDWAGKLELSPNPFDIWPEAGSILVNSSGGGSTRRLLQTSSSTGQVPVQGMVTIREVPTASSSDNSQGVLPLDDTGVGSGFGNAFKPDADPHMLDCSSATYRPLAATSKLACCLAHITVVCSCALQGPKMPHLPLTSMCCLSICR